MINSNENMVAEKYNKKTKRFLTPILLLVIGSIIIIASIITYINIHMQKQHINNDIEKKKIEYLEKEKSIVYEKVHLIDKSIKFLILQRESALKKELKERIETALNIANDIYIRHKAKFSDDEIKEKIVKHLRVIRFNKGRGYYFVYDNKNNILLSHVIKEIIGQDVKKLVDAHDTNILKPLLASIKKDKISFAKIYFNKPEDTNKLYPKLDCAVKFEPLDLIIGTGEYLDVVEDKLKEYAVKRFSNFETRNNNYIFISDLHNINGGDNFATLLVNPNKPNMIGKKLSDSYQDAQGKKFRKEYLQGLKQNGEVYIKYLYKKPDNSSGVDGQDFSLNTIKDQRSKMSYFYLQKDWNWIIGCGFYFDDLEQQISKMESEFKKTSNDMVINAIILIVIVSMIVIIIAIYVSMKIDKTIKRYTNEIIDKKHELELAQEVAKMGSWSLDFITNKLNWSDETYKIFEISKSKPILTFETFLDEIYPDDKEMINTAYATSLKDKQPYSIIHRLLMKDGRIKWVKEKCETTFDDNGNPLISNGTVQDITKEYKKNEELKAKEQQMLHQSRFAQMGEMINMIAHQWRQPLNAISLTSNNLAFKCMMDDYDKDLFQKEIGLIDEYSQHLSKTIDDFRGFFKENKEKEITTLEKIVNSTLNIVKVSVENKNIKLIIDLNCNKELKTYPSEIKQVLLNLIKNAEDILLENKIENPTITIKSSCRIGQDNQVLVVKDNAGGIPDDIIDKIFDPYFSTKLEKDGTGLGLYMSKTIIEEHCGGKISVSNDKDGATFKIILVPAELDEFNPKFIGEE
ncbi:MAG: cache domain-containing protein [Arcobacteraceae bacterium]|nr:cache domain-containing protein [Arcobacteraceae bacterium]